MRTARNWIIQVFLENHRLKSRRNLENGSLFPGTRPTFFLGRNWERLPRAHACIYRVCMWRHVYNCVCKPWASLGLVCQRSCVNVCVWVCECRRIDHGNCCDDHACVCVCVCERERVCVKERVCDMMVNAQTTGDRLGNTYMYYAYHILYKWMRWDIAKELEDGVLLTTTMGATQLQHTATHCNSWVAPIILLTTTSLQDLRTTSWWIHICKYIHAYLHKYI